jgi:probable blue pigment (indigoidine) exporter
MRLWPFTALGVAIVGEAFGPLQALGVLLVLGGVLAGQPGTLAWVRRSVTVRRTAAASTAGECRA